MNHRANFLPRISRINTDVKTHKDITDKIIKGFYEVYNELGPGFLESVYENSLHIVLTEHGFNVEKQKELSVHFRGNVVAFSGLT